MWNIVVCDGNKIEQEQILEYIRRFSSETKQEIKAQGAANWPELFKKLEQEEPDVIIIAQNGVEGLNTITNIHLPPKRFIWFSDLDFSLQAYRLCLSWFGKKPITYPKLEKALVQCMQKELDLTCKGEGRDGL